MNVLDVVENSVAARLRWSPSRFPLIPQQKRMTPGPSRTTAAGMPPEMAARDRTCSCTTRKTRKIGLGLPF